jgi:hypothetical protein
MIEQAKYIANRALEMIAKNVRTGWLESQSIDTSISPQGNREGLEQTCSELSNWTNID